MNNKIFNDYKIIKIVYFSVNLLLIKYDVMSMLWDLPQPAGLEFLWWRFLDIRQELMHMITDAGRVFTVDVSNRFANKVENILATWIW